MRTQELTQEVLVPQEHTSGEKRVKLRFIKILSTRSRKKLWVLPQAANNRKKFTVVGLISNRQIYNRIYGKHEQQNVILISLLFLLRKGKKQLHVFRTMQTIWLHCENGLKVEGKGSIFTARRSRNCGSKSLFWQIVFCVWDRKRCMLHIFAGSWACSLSTA